MQLTVEIFWTETARQGLATLPPKVRAGLIGKAEQLLGTDPRDFGKPLVGPLANHYRITYGRYRAIYTVKEKTVKGQRTLVLQVLFIAAGKRKEHSKDDIYRLAEKLVRLLERGKKPEA